MANDDLRLPLAGLQARQGSTRRAASFPGCGGSRTGTTSATASTAARRSQSIRHTLRSAIWTGGIHTVSVNEYRPSGATGWSAPYPFLISTAVPALTISAFCNAGDGNTHEECRANAENKGLRARGGTRWWVRGVEDWDRVRYRFDDGQKMARTRMNEVFARLSLGRHTIEVNEYRASGETGWSPPYVFWIVAR